MILIEIKIEARYLKKNSQTPQGKNRENLNRSNTYGFWAIISCFSVERDFSNELGRSWPCQSHYDIS